MCLFAISLSGDERESMRFAGLIRDRKYSSFFKSATFDSRDSRVGTRSREVESSNFLKGSSGGRPDTDTELLGICSEFTKLGLREIPEDDAKGSTLPF